MTTQQEILARKVYFGAKMRQDETQQNAAPVRHLKKKEKRERGGKREKEGRRNQKRKFLHPYKDLVLVHADGLGQG